MRLAIAVLCMFPVAWSQANAGEPTRFIQRSAEGWFWYHDPRVAPDPAVMPAPPPPPVESLKPLPAPAAFDPVAAVKAQGERVQYLLSDAVLDPTPEKVSAFLQFNAMVQQQAADFAQSWQRVIWSTPELDYGLKSPTGSAAYIQADIDAEQRDELLAGAAQRYGLVFFFRGSCSYCHQFAPVLKAFAQTYGFSLIDVSLDGGTLPDFPHPRANLQAASALKADVTPATYIIDPRTRSIVPAAFGYVGFSDLAARVVQAVQSLESGAQLAIAGDAP